MKILRFKHQNEVRLGLLDGEVVVDVLAALAAQGRLSAEDAALAADTLPLLDAGERGVALLRRALAAGNGAWRKAASDVSIASPLLPRVTKKLDYEVELAIVIGKKGRHITEARALEHVFGYTILNDVTARDKQ